MPEPTGQETNSPTSKRLDRSGRLKKQDVKKQSEKKSVRELYQEVKDAEQKPPNPEETISLGNALSESERLQFEKAGIKPEDGRAKRKDILEAGFVFKNRIGEGEKPIINSTINGVNLGEKTFLTKDELAAVIDYQASNPQYRLPPEANIDDIRQDMLSFLLSSQVAPVFTRHRQMAGYLPSENPNAYVQNKKGADLARLIGEYRNHLRSQFANRHPEITLPLMLKSGYEEEFIEEKCADIYTPDESASTLFFDQKVRGMQADIIPQRTRKVSENPSPFLDSGFHFGGNPDVFVYGRNINAMRVNAVSFHLASRGLSEMGDSPSGRSHDQHYASLKEYYDNIFPKDPDKRRETWELEEDKITQREDRDEVVGEIRQRFLDEANKWKREQPKSHIPNIVRKLSPREALRKLASKRTT